MLNINQKRSDKMIHIEHEISLLTKLDIAIITDHLANGHIIKAVQYIKDTRSTPLQESVAIKDTIRAALQTVHIL